MKPHDIPAMNQKGQIAIEVVSRTAFTLADEVGPDAVASALMFTLGLTTAGTIQATKPDTFKTEKQLDEFATSVVVRLVETVNSILREHGCELPIVDLRQGKPTNN